MEDLIYTIFNGLPRLGPGDDFSTRKAFYALPSFSKDAHVLDIGCGTGHQTLELARQGDFHILALDNHEPYLRELMVNAKNENLENQISVIHGDMQNLPFSEAEFDLIWSEGSIYIIGFENGLIEWKKFLKPKGFIVCTEVAWIKNDPPEELLEFWHREYPEIKYSGENEKIIARAGYELKQNFILPKNAWWDNFYHPLQKRVHDLREGYQEQEGMMIALDSVQLEIDMYLKYSNFYGYVCYIMKLGS